MSNDAEIYTERVYKGADLALVIQTQRVKMLRVF